MASRIRLLTPAQERALSKDIARGIHRQKAAAKPPETAVQLGAGAAGDLCACGHRPAPDDPYCGRPASPRYFIGCPLNKLQRQPSVLEAPLSVMLDSGAYSAWYHGAPISLDAYIDYVKANGRLFDSIVALDVIPGGDRAAAKTSADVEEAARLSHKNYLRMRRADIEPIPVFHQGEDWEWLDRMIDDQIPYIGISPLPRAGQESILEWLDRVFTRITDKDGRPLVKTHGFGATSFRMIANYPWFSIDSTTWALAAGYGTIIVPPHNGYGLPDFGRPPLRFSISDRDTAGSRPLLKEGQHTRQLIDKYLAHLGLTVSDIRSTDRHRAHVNAFYYVELERHLKCETFQHRIGGQPARKPSESVVPFTYSPRVIFAEQIGKTDYGRALIKCGAQRRLLSYYEIRKHKTLDPVKEYIQSGLWTTRDRKGAGKKPWSQSYIVQRRLGLLARLQEEDPNV